MAVYVVDARAAIELVRRGHHKGSGEDELFAPTLLRSQVLATLRSEVVAGELDAAEALRLQEGACRLPHRLLGDAVLRETAWNMAVEHGWPDTYDAEYIALTRLHGEALITVDEELRAKASGIVNTQTVDGFLAESG